jgi:hypothetical protein
MAKITLEFDLEEEREMYEAALNGASYKEQIEQIWQHCFRPLNKHGYHNSRLAELVQDEKVKEAIEILSTYYFEVLRDD